MDKKVADIIAAVIVVSIVMIIFFCAVAPKQNTTKTKETTVSQEVKVDLAQETQKVFLEDTYGFTSLYELQTDPNQPDGSNIRYINGFENVSSGTVRVLVQEDITKDEAKSVGLTVMGATGLDIPGLKWITVQGTNGVWANVSRNDIPALRN